jgi:hypothetical protein
MAEGSTTERVVNLADDEWFDTRGLAQRLKITKRCLEHWRVVGGGPAYYRVGQHVRYSKTDVEDWLAKRSFAHTSEYGGSKVANLSKEGSAALTAPQPPAAPPSIESKDSSPSDGKS